jgi:hypothetical protein
MARPWGKVIPARAGIQYIFQNMLKKAWAYPPLAAVLVWFGFSAMVFADDLAAQIASANTSAENGQYTTTVRQLRVALQTAVSLQKTALLDYFPASFDDYVGADLLDLSELPSEDSLTVLFARHYQGPDGAFIDVNIVSDDASVADLISLLDKPKKVPAASGWKRIKIKGNPGLERVLPKEAYAERNIRIGTATVINMIGHGLGSPTVLDTFCDRINWFGLKEYLTKH